MINKSLFVAILIGATISFVSCSMQVPPSGPATGTLSAPTGTMPAPPRPEAVSNPQIDAYLAGLKYDSRQILAEQVGDSVIPAKPLPDEVQDDGKAIVICKQVKHHLSGNIDDMLIFNPTHGVIWPGALVTVDQDLVRGTPAPLSLRRAPMWLSVDLPGIGGRGVFQVDDPSQGTVQAAIDGALDYWNNYKYQEGYVSKARSQYAATVVYSAEQLAASLGVTYGNFANSIATQFKMTTSHESKVAVALFKQVFYTVSFDPPSHPGAVFDPGVTLDDVRNGITGETPAGYVSSVDYGRILMLQIEASADTLDTDLQAAAKYGALKVKASADYQKILQKSKITLFTIGGNAEVNAQVVSATRIEDLQAAIQGQNALYSKSNPGQPISYTIRFLKDGRLAKMGYSTDYTEVSYERQPYGWIAFKHNAPYYAKFYLNWKEGDQAKSWTSGKLTHNWESPQIQLKGNAHDIQIQLQSYTGFHWVQKYINLDAPPNKRYVSGGTSFYPNLSAQ
jgi:thiol-activated cytolysin